MLWMKAIHFLNKLSFQIIDGSKNIFSLIKFIYKFVYLQIINIMFVIFIKILFKITTITHFFIFVLIRLTVLFFIIFDTGIPSLSFTFFFLFINFRVSNHLCLRRLSFILVLIFLLEKSILILAFNRWISI